LPALLPAPPHKAAEPASSSSSPSSPTTPADYLPTDHSFLPQYRP
jgi:hypothetical protein